METRNKINKRILMLKLYVYQSIGINIQKAEYY